MTDSSAQAIINASPLIFLDKINQLNLLALLFSTVFVTSAVLEEISAGQGGTELKKRVLDLSVINIVEPKELPIEAKDRNLGRGEASIIAWARSNPDLLLIIDDRAGLARALAYGLSATGTIGILILSKQRGIIGNVRSYLDDLEKAGCWISADVRQKALSKAGEQE